MSLFKNTSKTPRSNISLLTKAHSNFVKNTPLRVVFSTLCSVLDIPIKQSLVFDILLELNLHFNMRFYTLHVGSADSIIDGNRTVVWSKFTTNQESA